MRAGRLATVGLFALAVACSPAQDEGAPPASVAEQRALDDARAMIPPSELPAATPTQPATESAADDQ